jgi:aspartate kinase
MQAQGKAIVVQKYGGSSVADPERLGQVAERVAATVRSGHRVVVVVSAMGKTTDQLLALARSMIDAPPRRELDMLLSTGERISMALLAMALAKRGIEAISFTGSQSGILTNDRHSGARIIEVRPVRIEDELERGKVVIVAGFQGMSYRREITTLGRGGSDTTAVALAAALSAEYCEICSDVDGVYSADPKVVPDARLIPSLGYEEMQELAEHGAKVLNAQAVEWARKEKIILYARATSADKKGETRIGPAAEPRTRRAVAVTGSEDVVVVTGGREALSLLAEEGATLRHASAEQIRLVRHDLPDWSRIEGRLKAAGASIGMQGEVTVVGPGVGSDPQLVARALALAAPVLGYDAAPLRLTLYVDPPRVPGLQRALHAELCGSPPAS